MWLIDQLVEKHIAVAQSNGELDNLPGSGKKLLLEDDSHVPAELRVAWRLMKNSGFLPPELEMRREAIELDRLLAELDPDNQQYEPTIRHLLLLQMKLQQAGINTDFLQGEYSYRLHQRLKGAKPCTK